MRTIPSNQLSRLLAGGAVSLVAVFGLAACNDGASEGDTVESEEMSEESADEEMSGGSTDEEMSEESMDDGMSEEPMDEESMDEEMSEESMEGEDMEDGN